MEILTTLVASIDAETAALKEDRVKS